MRFGPVYIISPGMLIGRLIQHLTPKMGNGTPDASGPCQIPQQSWENSTRTGVWPRFDSSHLKTLLSLSNT